MYMIFLLSEASHSLVDGYNGRVRSTVSRSQLSWPVLLALAVNTGLALSYIGLWFIAARDELLWRADFSAYYTGGAIARDGLGSQLYDLDLQSRYQLDFLGGQSFSQGVLPFNSPPHLALLMIPISLIPYSQAFLVWTFLQLLLLAALVALLLQFTRLWQPLERWLVISACLALPGLMRSFLIGAFSLLMLLCLLGWYQAHKQGADRLAGGWLLIGAVRPQILVCPALTSITGQRWKTVMVGFLGGIVIFIAPGITFGWKIWPDFIHRLLASGKYFDEFGINPAAMYNLKGTLTLWLGSSQSGVINLISLGAYLFSLLLTIWLWRGAWNPQQPVFPLRIAFTLLLNTFFGLHVNLQDGLLLAAPAFLFYEYLRQQSLPRKAYAIIALSCPAIFLIDEFYLSAYLPIRLAVVAMIVMLVWTGIYLRRENRQFILEKNRSVDIHE